MFKTPAKGFVLALAGVAGVTMLLLPLRERISPMTVGLALLLVVLLIAREFGSRPAYVASVLAALGLNFFFLPPFNTLTIAAPENWVALIVFMATALIVGELSARAKERAEEAESGRREIERLYEELRGAFGRASQAEALRRSEQLKTALLDAVTHDLRTPLTSIKASVTTLLKESENSPVADEPRVTLDEEGRREMLEVIDEESDRLNHLIEGMVELARIEAGDIELRRTWGSIDEIISMAVVRAEPLTRRHRVRVDIENELPLVRADSRAIAEVIFLLIDNASKYAPPDSRIFVTARRTSNEMILFEVQDEGRGIPAELRERVFVRFFRATPDDAAALDRPSGLGMGLAIARGIIEAQGGRIWIESGSNGQGTRVLFTIPIGDD
jgi:K+-sensing histidine kinase KdpD